MKILILSLLVCFGSSIMNSISLSKLLYIPADRFSLLNMSHETSKTISHLYDVNISLILSQVVNIWFRWANKTKQTVFSIILKLRCPCILNSSHVTRIRCHISTHYTFTINHVRGKIYVIKCMQFQWSEYFKVLYEEDRIE